MQTLPYAEIPQHPEKYTSETVVARLIDGLGFRYYWATEGLREVDLAYKPSENARTTIETIDHIYSLVSLIYKTVLQKEALKATSFKDKRANTLHMLKETSDFLRFSNPGILENTNIIFNRDNNIVEFPFWNLINGPIADAIWHVGQVVSFRRSSGNPISKKISVFTGTVRKQ